MNAPTSAFDRIRRTHVAHEHLSLTLHEAAAYCGKSRSWLTKLEKAGTAPPSIKVGRERRYLKADLDAFLAGGRK